MITTTRRCQSRDNTKSDLRTKQKKVQNLMHVQGHVQKSERLSPETEAISPFLWQNSRAYYLVVHVRRDGWG